MDSRKIVDELKRQRVQKAIDAGFTESQAKYLVEQITHASLGFGGMFL